MSAVHRSTIYVRIDSWEYECCATVPAEGVTLAGKLFAIPSQFPNGQVSIDEWDRERELVRFAGGSARWDPERGDPFNQPVCILLSWHGGEPGVGVIGIAIETHQLYRDVDPARSDVSHPREEARKLPALQKFSEEAVVASDGTVLKPAGALVALGDLVLSEPTVADIAVNRAAQERGRRTVHITGPAFAFGDVIPGRGEHLRIDLDDDRLDVSGAPEVTSRIVVGLTQQVSAMRPVGDKIAGAGLVAMVSVGAGQPASSISEDLLVVLVIDEECLR